MIRGSVRARHLTTALAMIVIGVVWITIVDRPPGPRPVGAGSPAAGPAARPPVVTPVTARDVLAKADVLQLTADQRTRLASAATAWDRERASLQAALDAATEEFTRFARSAQQAGRTRLDDVRSRTEDVQSLSALLRERRVRHAADALGVLSASQRSQVPDVRQTTGGRR